LQVLQAIMFKHLSFILYVLRVLLIKYVYVNFMTPLSYHILMITITRNSHCVFYTFLSKFPSNTANTTATFEQCPQHLFQNMSTLGTVCSFCITAHTF